MTGLPSIVLTTSFAVTPACEPKSNPACDEHGVDVLVRAEAADSD